MKRTLHPAGAFILFLLPFWLCAQGTLRGVVSDEKGETLIGASVVIKGTSTGTSTDIDGSYEFRAPAGTHIVAISYTGYQSKEQTVTITNGAVTTMNFSLREETRLLEEVVVIGYGVQRKRDLIGSVSKIDSKELLDFVGSSFENALQGKVTGVNLTQTSGLAGAGAHIRIRGASSLSSGGEPLIVVDGIAITQDQFLTGSRNAQNNNPLASINPNDIESVEVLKDASSAAIYGSRGANGVILITTKRGRNTKPTFNFSSRVGTSNPTRRVELLNSQEWLQIRQEAWENDGNVGRAPLPLQLVTGGIAQNSTDYESIAGIDTDWLDQVLRTGIKQEHSLSFTAGKNKLNTYLGATYSNAESYIVGNSFERGSLRANLDYRLRPNMSIGISTSLTRSLIDKPRQAWAGGLGTAQTTALPIYPIHNEDGTYFNIYQNPVAELEYYSNKTREWRTINNLIFNYSPVKGLDLNLTGNMDYMNLGDYEWESVVWTTDLDRARGTNIEALNWSTFGTATYNVPLKNTRHNLRAMVGTEYQQSSSEGTFESFVDLAGHIFENPAKGEAYMQESTSAFDVDKWRFFSIFSRVNYSFADKYLLQFVYRRDGSSKFGRNRRFGNFPSVGLGYIVSEEPFMKEIGLINFLKLKASWGITGNSEIRWREQYAFRSYPFPDQDNAGLYYNNQFTRAQTKPENANVQWEVVNNYDAGFDLGMLNDRIILNFSYFYKRTSSAFLFRKVQASSGAVDELQFYENIAKMENRGWEIGLTTRNISGRKLRWETNLNLTRTRNQVLDVGTAPPDALDGGFGDVRVLPGLPIGVNYLVPFVRVDSETGRPVYLDADGKETFVYDVATARSPVDNIFPEFAGGITNILNFGQFDFSFQFNFQLGGTIYDDAAKRSLGVVTDWNMRREIFDRWRQPGDVARFPQLTMSMINWGGNDNFWQNNHTLWLYDGSFARLRNVTFGYTANITSAKSPFKSFRVYINATNLLTFTKFDGWDPEVSRDRNTPQERNIGGVGVTYLTPPQERTVNFGINLQF